MIVRLRHMSRADGPSCRPVNDGWRVVLTSARVTLEPSRQLVGSVRHDGPYGQLGSCGATFSGILAAATYSVKLLNSLKEEKYTGTRENQTRADYFLIRAADVYWQPWNTATTNRKQLRLSQT